MLFLHLILFPHAEGRVFVCRLVAAEDMRMAEYELFDDAGYYVGACEGALFLLHDRVECRLKENIAALLLYAVVVAAVDGVDEFVGLLNHVLLD